MDNVVHYYAFSTRSGTPIPVYERTFGTLALADKWQKQKTNRFITVNSLPSKYWY